jgi:hypothetical protein
MDNGVKREWNAVSKCLIPNPRLYFSFRNSAHGKKLAMWLKLSNDEKAAWNYDIGTWTDDYVKQHPSTFIPTLYNTLHGYMKELSDEMGMQKQSTLGKKE